METGKKRLAVLVGCNYPNTEYELRGCINDVMGMRETLMSRFGFEQTRIEVLTDQPDREDSSWVKPTGANIKKVLREMVDKAEPGDILFFHYSGHGTIVPSRKPGNPFHKGEAIVPCDFNLITDVDFRDLVNGLPKGASFTMLSDSCHSGGLIDNEKEQIGPKTAPNPTEHTRELGSLKPKSIPFESVLSHVSALTNINTPDIATHMLELFGADSSLKFRASPNSTLTSKLEGDDGILLSGCQANEFSADLGPTKAGRKACGMFSNAVETVFKENPGKLSNREVVMMARSVMAREALGGLTQHPCLYCSDENANAVFLWQQ